MLVASISGHDIEVKNGYVVVKCQSQIRFRRPVMSVLKEAQLLCSACGIMPDPFALVEFVSDAAGLVSDSFECD